MTAAHPHAAGTEACPSGAGTEASPTGKWGRPPRLPSSAPVTRWLLAAPMAVAIVFSWMRLVAEPFDVPRDEDYVRASALLRAEGFDRTRDVLAILPPWSLRPLTHVADLEPVSGDDIADRPLHRYARLWAIVEADADAEHGALVARRGPPSWSRDVGRVVVQRWDLPAPSATYDLSARLVDARVTSNGTACSAVAASTHAQPSWRCGDDAWQRVRREWLHVSENADLAVFAHPPAEGRLELTWSDVPVGTSVVVTAGFTRDGAAAAVAPVRVRVLVDGDLAGTVVRAPAFLFATDVVDTSRWAGRTGAVTIAIDSDSNAGAHFAFDAYVVGAR